MLDLFLRVRHRRDDEQPVEQIDRDAVRRLVVRAADACDAAVGGDHEHRSKVGLERAVQVREALDVEHVHLVDEEDAWHDLRLALLPPLGDLLVNLVAHLSFDLAGVASKQGEEALLPRVDHIHLVQRHHVHHLLTFLQLTLWRLYELCVRPHGVVVARAGERAAEHGDAAGRLVDRDDVTRLHLLLRQRVDHLLPEVVHGLHLRRLECELARLGCSCRRPHRRAIDLNLDNLALDDLGLLLNAHADRPPERLRQRLRLVHLEREDLRRCDGGERRVRAERLRHAHRDRSLAGAGLARDEDGTTRDLPVADHREDYARCLPRRRLTDHALRDSARLKRVIQAEAADVRVGADALDARDVTRDVRFHPSSRHGRYCRLQLVCREQRAR
mmetsp:Transcript_27388/g.69692  ORF Transcript_27388/g.69692 Transcript_27388/m.69692 type:complete len:387 (+) Transcript_27388:657-1817(+)